MYRYKKQIQPTLGKKPIKSITPADCQTLISILFKGAIAHKLIPDNPLSIVVKTKHQYKHGTALTKDEEKLL
mgnify:CR=1 FL=1